ncbi:uncharacterized protein LOC118755117 [Rhagoletis pomonella]|uniref:uncharacterized protein LOC118755117 n=1 Tax=Rhagoletis pomonella TaxID=28610 RepID=UPI001784D408|nr:uncharacterized protein LOC118755117 [Rhagoletis pomonella]
MMDSQRHVNQQMKNVLTSISKLFEIVESNDPEGTSVSTSVKSTQTDRPVKGDKTGKRSANESTPENRPQPKDKRIRVNSPRAQAEKIYRQTRSSDQPATADNAAQNPKGDNQSLCSNVTTANLNMEWTKVKPKRRPRKKPTRPDAIVVKSSGECSYADILKMVKSEESLKGLSETVRKIRKTASGDLLFQLNKSEDVNTAKLQEAVEGVLAGEAEVRTLTEMVHIEIHDIDEVTTSEKVCLALNGHGGSTKVLVSDIRSMRKAYGGTQTATLLLPESFANKLVGQGKIRIGWVICRIRHKIQPKRCYKCFEFGHISKGCRSSDDFGKSCFKCGQTGHTAKLCTNAPRCLLCVKRGSNPTSHQAGGNKCPVYQLALSKIKV